MPSQAMNARAGIPSARRRVVDGGGTPGTIPNDPTGVQAAQADAFVESIGVNVHFANSKYSAVYDSIIKPKLVASGIRYVREGIENTGNIINRLIDVHDNHGIKAIVITNATRHTADFCYSFVVDSVKPHRIHAVEGTNEPELNGQMAVARSYQISIWNKFKGSSATAHIPIVAPSVLKPANAQTIGDISAYVDYGCMHHYCGGRNPESAGWGSVLNGYRNGSVEYDIFNTARVCCGPTKGIFNTECGYHNAVMDLYPHRGTPENVEEKYLPRMYLHYWNKGVVKNYTYEFYDQNTGEANPERNFGMIRTNGSEKPAYVAVKNMISVLNDRGTSFSPGKLNFSLSGSTSNIFTSLFQKRDGKFYLAIWLGVQEWNADTRVETPAASQTVTVSVPTIATAEVCTPSSSASFSSVSISNGSFTVSVNGHAKIFRLTHV